MDVERNLEAAQEFAKAVELKPDDYESTFNAGVAYRQAGRNPEAERYYRKAVKLRPQDASSHMNLGAMLHLVGKLQEAEDHYFQALKLRPSDQNTAINIQRLHRAMASKGLSIKHSLNWWIFKDPLYCDTQKLLFIQRKNKRCFDEKLKKKHYQKRLIMVHAKYVRYLVKNVLFKCMEIHIFYHSSNGSNYFSFLYKAEIQGAFESFCDKMLLLWDS